jgi:hypothetical protein
MMNLKSFLMAQIFILLAIPWVGKAQEQIFQKTGVRITKPAHWVFLEKNDRAEGTIALVGLHKEPYPNFNPTCRITGKPSGPGKNAEEIAQEEVHKMKQKSPDFQLLEGPRETTLGGQKGAFFKAKFSVSANGNTNGVLWRMWFIPRSTATLTVIMLGPQTGSDVCEEEFKTIAGSIRISSS